MSSTPHLADTSETDAAPRRRGRKPDASGRSREAILEAALQLVCEKGAGALTIESVAERAGFSKGGVLYNFPNKELLVKGMVEREVEGFASQVETERQRQLDLGSGCPTLAALVEAGELWIRGNDAGPRGILLTHVSAPDLCEPFLAHKEKLRDEMRRETRNLPRAMLVWSALEGVLMSYAHGVMRFSDTELTAFFDELRSLLRGSFLNEGL
ncbi:TetR/AcrR family transcriptional regulator [Roseibium aestuarii]|uniref:TetR/AcrR family transcriptional regulator n=1 Tax=Roseibium aestuarii TaxID=2600299 RepID=A0ABW4JTP0_9HYPH|nr:TetR/AcrR family transcriptional regulator [Roseibium aestuarii]